MAGEPLDVVVVLDELGKEAGGEDMVAFPFGRTLHEIGGVALEIFKEFLADRERPDALAGVPADTAAGIAVADRFLIIAITALLTPPAVLVLRRDATRE